MKPLLPDFDKARVLVFGDIMLDRYYEGDVARISPEAPVPIVRVETVSDSPGGAGNVALNIAALGAKVSLIGFAGEDEEADALEAQLCAAGVTTCIRRVSGQSTVTKLRVMSRRQQLIRLDFEPASSEAWAGALSDLNVDTEIAARLDSCDVLVLSDYGKGALVAPGKFIAMARDRGVPVLVDPKTVDFQLFRGATLLTPNAQEFEAVVGHCATEADLVARGLALIADLELGGLLITRGDQGMTLLRPDHEEYHLPARAREVFDVTGAGDTVIAVIATALAAGADLQAAVATANIAASLVVEKMGTATVSAPELRLALGAELGPERGVLSPEQLLIVVNEARGRGDKIVFTNGCFDILHAGHVAYLEEARALGHRLIVGVNGDASLRRLKGEGRPINPVERRMAVLAGLESVDWVVAFEQDTPEDLLRYLRPDVLVKGGDYSREEEVVGWQIVADYGGEVRLTGKTASASTSDIVSRINAKSKR